nr:hypothetical protein CFP56_00827 [Quercus suber]
MPGEHVEAEEVCRQEGGEPVADQVGDGMIVCRDQAEGKDSGREQFQDALDAYREEDIASGEGSDSQELIGIQLRSWETLLTASFDILAPSRQQKIEGQNKEGGQDKAQQTYHERSHQLDVERIMADDQRGPGQPEDGDAEGGGGPAKEWQGEETEQRQRQGEETGELVEGVGRHIRQGRRKRRGPPRKEPRRGLEVVPNGLDERGHVGRCTTADGRERSFSLSQNSPTSGWC